ncbi:NADH-quinone oxidoreductase subunit NuoN [Pelomonas sp. UHG3]|jgi:NADH-quinone oxidoreductase subunit N|uniref:NADH-quinone oxidoreductase subunit NuoN n=1 Tax=Roseateles hydrophilus TaxID=2975054 RepID=A0ACC6C741_9BURK|nr:NADH-quinone oxidoreductase subunit NuoN [Pelomonas sp. UHG3]MCY4744232.1 NADH-quinone oxidoreductase subunit NuoN [Pelomonas sp. UHG3]
MNDMNWLAIYPEILLLVMGCVVALADLWVTDEQRRPTYWLTQLTLVVVGGMHFAYFDAGVTTYAMQGMVVADPMGHLLAGFACVATLITLVYARPYAASREMLKGELFILALFALLGINVMLSANNFLVIYLGLELMSLSLYALVALRRDHAVSTEAAMKYFVLGALASGFLLYGLSMMYGATGSLTIPEVFDVITKGIPNKSVLVFGTVFVVAGLAFKLGAAPFHMWVPDVYQGAPTAVTLMIGGAPKLAAFAITVRLLVEGMSGLAVDWQQMLVVLSVMSLLVGNLAAIAQTNFKRMLAYSTIANMGFMVLGLTAGVVNESTQWGSNAYSAAMFYAVTYVLTTLGTFGMVILLSRAGHEAEEIKDLAGLAKRSPWFALVMTLFMFSLAGIPPMVGFYAKLAVLQALVVNGHPFYLGLAIFAVVVSLVGAFYYLRIVKVMFFDAPADTTPLAAPADVRFVMTLNGAAVLVFGLMPGGLLELCKVAIRQALAT